MDEHVSSDTARKMIADPYCPVTTRCLAEDVLAARKERDEARATLDAERRRGIRMAAVLTKVADACIEDDAQVFFDRLDEALGLCSGSTWWQTADALRELVGGSHD